MGTPWLTIVIPTMGREELRHTLDSIDAQAKNGSVQVLVVADTFEGIPPAVTNAKAEVLRRGSRYRWLEHDGGFHCWGQQQRQYGMEQADGEWICFSADDNVLAPGAIAKIWQGIIETPAPMPLLFKVRTWQAGIVWKRQSIENGNIDADCFVVPNVPEKLGKWTNEYNGDFKFMQETATLWGGRVGWRDELIALARPQQNEMWWTMQNPPRILVSRYASV